MLAGLAEGLRSRSTVSLADFYCYIDVVSLDKVGQGISIAHLIVLVALEIHLAIFIRRHLTSDVALGGRRVGGIRLGLILRPMIFGAYCVLGLMWVPCAGATSWCVLTCLSYSIALVIIGHSASAWTTFLLSTFGYAVFAIYASQVSVWQHDGSRCPKLTRRCSRTSCAHGVSGDASARARPWDRSATMPPGQSASPRTLTSCRRFKLMAWSTSSRWHTDPVRHDLPEHNHRRFRHPSPHEAQNSFPGSQRRHKSCTRWESAVSLLARRRS